ncbi:MAG TPA: hypothetical protein VJN18_03250 [Polyangiaceae bacterium]|nr:hypothetical protein [Polyangiaceae bacterium]
MLEANFCVDQHRIFASGFASGPGFTNVGDHGTCTSSTGFRRQSGLRQVLAGAAAGGAVGSATLLITFPLTKDLGTEL